MQVTATKSKYIHNTMTTTPQKRHALSWLTDAGYFKMSVDYLIDRLKSFKSGKDQSFVALFANKETKGRSGIHITFSPRR